MAESVPGELELYSRHDENLQEVEEQRERTAVATDAEHIHPRHATPRNNPQQRRMHQLHQTFMVWLTLILYIPQIVATIVILIIYWHNEDQKACDEPHLLRWKIWTSVTAFRMLIYSILIVIIYNFHTWLQQNHPRYFARAILTRNFIDGIGFIWFIVGNIWLLGNDVADGCSRPQSSPIYLLSVVMLILNYIQFGFPVFIAILCIPVMCCCMPCLLRALDRIEAHYTDALDRGVTTEEINATIPSIVVDATTFADGEEKTCAICLSEMLLGEDIRRMRCHHAFHTPCVDEWLGRNAICPTCRKNLQGEDDHNEGEGASVGDGERSDISDIAEDIGRNSNRQQRQRRQVPNNAGNENNFYENIRRDRENERQSSGNSRSATNRRRHRRRGEQEDGVGDEYFDEGEDEMRALEEGMRRSLREYEHAQATQQQQQLGQGQLQQQSQPQEQAGTNTNEQERSSQSSTVNAAIETIRSENLSNEVH